MENPNRIASVSMTPSIERQTPKTDFGETLHQAIKSNGNMLSSVIGQVPILSAAVSAVTQVASMHSSGVTRAGIGAVSTTSALQSNPTGAMNGSTTQASNDIDNRFSDPSIRESYLASKDFLRLQNEAQQESREYNAVSNLLKVRHDSAKAAINNVR